VPNEEQFQGGDPVTGSGLSVDVPEAETLLQLLKAKEFGETAGVTWHDSMVLIVPPAPQLASIVAQWLLQPWNLNNYPRLP